MRGDVATRFWPKVAKGDGCWLWMGAMSLRRQKGYFKLRGTMHSASRVSWELSFGPIPKGLFVLHHCDNPRCVRPDHLFIGTQADNVHDMENKGRGRKVRGEAHYAHKLTEENIREIHAARKRGLTQQKIAGLFGVSQEGISRILLGKGWRHVSV